MCGIVGEVVRSDQLVNQDLFDALTAMQHRGQDAAGIVTCDVDGKFHLRKSTGLARDVFHTRHMMELLGNMGIGHVRYPTAGSDQKDEAQPFYVNSPYGITLAHNGNITNAQVLRQELKHTNLRHLNTSSDSELILNVLAHALQQLADSAIDEQIIFTAVTDVMQRCKGGYAIVAMLAGYGVMGFRDPNGIRPLVYGKRQTANGTEYMIASESVVLDTLGFTVIADVAPGEAVWITQSGRLFKKQCVEPDAYSPCLFEYIYFARPDSIVDKSSVYKVRLRMGEYLADKIKTLRLDHDIDVVMPIPDTSRPTAQALAHVLQLKYREGFIKNRYIGRTFIMPGQQKRKKSVRQKLNPIPLEFEGKNVLLVDDSIVRGTTCQEIIQMARLAGAKKVYVASAAPEIRYPNVYGIDMPSAKELIAHDKSIEQICESLGADWLVYQDLSAVVTAAREGNPDIVRYEDSVFTGEYITGDIDEAYRQKLAQEREDSRRFDQTDRASRAENLDIYNRE